MTKPLPFTAAGIARAIKGVEKAGRFVLGVRPDGVLIVGDKPIDTASFVPVNEQPRRNPAYGGIFQWWCS